MNAGQSGIILERLMSLHPKIIDLVLDRVERLLGTLGNPEQNLPPVIHLAGTNGKGSTQAMVHSILAAAGKTAHAYTSPHLARFHERIYVAGQLITEEDLIAILEECETANQGQQITYFEITTCAAFLAFARTKADYCLLETGLGGRVDATNVVDSPKLTIITPISIDHQQFLGETLAEIAAEKAGIMKRGVPCIIAPQPEEAMEVLETHARKIGAEIIAYGQQWHVSEERGRMIYQDELGLLDLPLPNLIGAHQVVNAGSAIAAARQLGFAETAIEKGVTTAKWAGRMQRLNHGPLCDAAPDCDIWLDGGHNEAAGKALAEALSRLPERPLHAICGMLKTKDVSGFLGHLSGIAETLQAVSIPGEAATLTADETAKAAQKEGMAASVAPDVSAAVAQVTTNHPNARILICGSLYLAGSVLKENR